MLRLALLSLLLGAGMCQTDVSSSPDDVATASSASAASHSSAGDSGTMSPPSDAGPGTESGRERQGSQPAASGLDFPFGTWELTETNGGAVGSVAIITWTFQRDGSGVYAQDIQGRMMDAADASRPFQWTRISDSVVRVESSTFTRTGTRSARWSDSGSTGTLQRWE